MRCLVAAGLLLVLPLAVFAQAEREKSPAIQPIKVVALDRKEPVTYEKDIEPILLNKCAFCHSGSLKEGKLDMATVKAAMKQFNIDPAKPNPVTQ